jgi:hypothetical protein
MVAARGLETVSRGQRPAPEGGGPRPLSALALLPRFSAPLPSAGLLGAMDLAGADSFVHRNYTALFASVPVIAVGSIAYFLLRDFLAANSKDAGTATTTGGVEDALTSWLGVDAPSLRLDEQLALAGIVLVAMADRLEHDPAAYPLLACAAARLVPEFATAAEWRGLTGLTARARRAAVEVLRPTALSILVRSLTWGLVSPGEAL